MAVHVSHDNRLLVRAFVASLALHFLLALFLPIWAAHPEPDEQPVETLSFAHMVRLEIERPATHAPPAALPQTTKRSPVVTFARVKTELSVHSRKPQVLPSAVNGPAGTHAAAPKYVKAQQAAPLYARSPSTSEPVAVVRNTSPATPQPASLVGEHANAGANADRGGVLPLGAEQDPVLDPHDLAMLQKVGVHVTLVVTVGEDGRTEHVVFDPVLDAATERQLQAILANADWDAAVCGGGVSCEGTATIKL
jgi:hypothetical protein